MTAAPTNSKRPTQYARLKTANSSDNNGVKDRGGECRFRHPVSPTPCGPGARRGFGAVGDGVSSAQADLGEDALAGEQLGGQADHETHHGQAAIPGFGEVHEAEAGLGSVRHG
jgi:hypothetical protein